MMRVILKVGQGLPRSLLGREVGEGVLAVVPGEPRVEEIKGEGQEDARDIGRLSNEVVVVARDDPDRLRERRRVSAERRSSLPHVARCSALVNLRFQ